VLVQSTDTIPTPWQTDDTDARHQTQPPHRRHHLTPLLRQPRFALLGLLSLGKYATTRMSTLICLVRQPCTALPPLGLPTGLPTRCAQPDSNEFAPAACCTDRREMNTDAAPSPGPATQHASPIHRPSGARNDAYTTLVQGSCAREATTSLSTTNITINRNSRRLLIFARSGTLVASAAHGW
jgi:hypothetical protein